MLRLAIGEADTVPVYRDWNKFCELEKDFVAQHGVEAWQYEFNFRIKPALDKDSDRWLLIQWCGGGFVEMEVV